MLPCVGCLCRGGRRGILDLYRFKSGCELLPWQCPIRFSNSWSECATSRHEYSGKIQRASPKQSAATTPTAIPTTATTTTATTTISTGMADKVEDKKTWLKSGGRWRRKLAPNPPSQANQGDCSEDAPDAADPSHAAPPSASPPAESAPGARGATTSGATASGRSATDALDPALLLDKVWFLFVFFRVWGLVSVRFETSLTLLRVPCMSCMALSFRSRCAW